MLRTVENAHDSCITACAFSAELDLVVTGDDAGFVHVYDFQKLYLLFCCESHRHEIRALHFHTQAPLLISGDSNGVVYIWQTTGVIYTASPLMRLALYGSGTPVAPSSARMPRTPPHFSSLAHSKHQQQHHHQLTNAPPVTSICSTLESSQTQPLILVACENGEVFVWDFRVVVSVARKRAIAATHFEFQSSSRDGVTDLSTQGFHQEAYNPLLRVAHKQSVLKLRPEDRNGVKNELSGGTHNGSSALKTVGEQNAHQGHHHDSGVVTCASTFSWTAHDETVLAIKCVPPDPGVVFTSSQDGRIKVWDAAHECVGTISTLDASSSSLSQKFGTVKNGVTGNGSSMASQANNTNGSSQSSSSSAWKFTHHLNSDASHRHTQIAAEVIHKFKRRKLKAQRKQQQQTRTRDRNKRDSDLDGFGGTEVGVKDAPLLVKRASSPSKGLKKGKPAGIEAILAAQLPFSREYSDDFSNSRQFLTHTT